MKKKKEKQNKRFKDRNIDGVGISLVTGRLLFSFSQHNC
jgi:hypothetical protein